MKKIRLEWEKGWESKVILTSVVQVAQDGIRYDEIKKRMRILDALEAVKEAQKFLYLEDADWDLLRACINGFKFGAAHKSLVSILSYVMEAEDGNPATSIPAESVPGQRLSGSAVRTPDSKPANGKLDTADSTGESVVIDAGKTEYMER